jgi:hypothetical protein
LHPRRETHLLPAHLHRCAAGQQVLWEEPAGKDQQLQQVVLNCLIPWLRNLLPRQRQVQQVER